MKSGPLHSLIFFRYESLPESQKHRTQFTINLITILDILFHLGYLAFFSFALHSHTLAALQAGGTLLCVFAFFLNRRGFSALAAILLTFEMGALSFAWVVFLGGACLMMLFILVTVPPHYLFTDVTKLQRRWLTLFQGICFAGNILLASFQSPLVSFHGMWIFALVTGVSAFSILALELSLDSLVEVFAEMTSSRRLSEALQDSMTDPLTAFWNRRFYQIFSGKLTAEYSQVKLAVAFMDIDNFKKINDRYSHDMGDRLLIYFAHFLRQNFRKSDIAIRWGGEEFVLLLPDADIEQAFVMLENFRSRLAESPMQMENGLPLPFTITCGLSMCEDPAGLTAAIALADRRMYLGKNNGRDQVVMSDAPLPCDAEEERV